MKTIKVLLVMMVVSMTSCVSSESMIRSYVGNVESTKTKTGEEKQRWEISNEHQRACILKKTGMTEKEFESAIKEIN